MVKTSGPDILNILFLAFSLPTDCIKASARSAVSKGWRRVRPFPIIVKLGTKCSIKSTK
jgi:hypothetical protein